MSDLLTRIQTVVSKPKQITSPWAPPTDVVSEVLALPESRLNYSHFSFLLLGTFEESLYFIPSCLSYLRKSHDEGYEAISELFTFVSSHESRLTELKVYADIVESLREIFFAWINQFEGRKVLNNEGKVLVFASVKNEARDEFLRVVAPSNANVSNGLLFKSILASWSENRTNPIYSAHFLDFCVQTKLSPVKRDLYDNGIVTYVCDQSASRLAHWAVAGSIIKERCPLEYVDFIQSEILN